MENMPSKVKRFIVIVKRLTLFPPLYYEISNVCVGSSVQEHPFTVYVSCVAYRRGAQISSLGLYFLKVQSSKSTRPERYTSRLRIKLNNLSFDAFCPIFSIGRDPTKCIANNCLQIIVCSCIIIVTVLLYEKWQIPQLSEKIL